MPTPNDDVSTKSKRRPKHCRYSRLSLFKTCTSKDGGRSTQITSHISGLLTDANTSAAILADLGTQN
ncbi:hypothetical protein DVH24_012015 [Malus domestica]|uniref:Uncharacterized protein n=1 Tax=Malus domestica TaxID=3750 RepID=A0A498HT68_MALDO|nr:hypothetical protein DVH24_012015 [Malus domestica]